MLKRENGNVNFSNWGEPPILRHRELSPLDKKQPLALPLFSDSF